MTVRTGEQKRSRLVLVTLVFALLVVTAGCVGDGEGPGGETNATTQEQVTEPPTDEPTEAPTEEPPATDEPTETEAPGGGDGGDGDAGGDESNSQTLLLLGALAVFAVGFVAAGVLRGRNKSEPKRETTAAPTPAEERRSDAERVISLLHKNNGRIFQDVLEEELDWSPSHTRRVLDGLVATGDVERRDVDGGWLIVFADPDSHTDEE
ncbi:hypothetical protein [Haloferax sp. DFSO52]|uniref:DUF7343 domain-containing protein n=1 Tax=Haloferax sp. DFSO52 TaxID=3388505 RepID=UPI003A89617C